MDSMNRYRLFAPRPQVFSCEWSIGETVLYKLDGSEGVILTKRPHEGQYDYQVEWKTGPKLKQTYRKGIWYATDILESPSKDIA